MVPRYFILISLSMIDYMLKIDSSRSTHQYRPRCARRGARRVDMKRVAHGLDGVVVATTRLSEVDGERGRLIIGGFPVEELAPHASFEEVLFLLWRDRLPSAGERDGLVAALTEQRALPDPTLWLLHAAARTGVEPMDALRMGV